MTASQRLVPQLAAPPQTIKTVDYLASLFIELERTASARYREAYLADEPHEQLKSRLISMVSDIGRDAADGSKVLHGTHFEIRLAFGDSNYFDPGRVCAFRFALIRNKIGRGVLPDIFEGRVSYQFRESAKQVLASLKLPAELLAQYESCRAKTPILTVQPTK